ncbi:MAG: hypothetical protein E6Q36_00230 [Chryseobacterium sp.]|nr:MAG: hypothetical protein E6Q36_00230 [Chryseobacterium sp.]
MIYTYVCQSCNKPCNIDKKITEPHPVTCLVCHGRLRRVIKTTTVIFKGDGWSKPQPEYPLG